MKKEKSETDNVYVCYCILREMHPGKHQAERLREVTEALWDAQTFYEKMGALMFGQAFVYGSREGNNQALEILTRSFNELKHKCDFKVCYVNTEDAHRVGNLGKMIDVCGLE